ncbi:bifunctional 3,4-dihydroxy-2-butanone 4-phosphate synthase/GTP cyclohydrolase II protein [Corynebacterium renale]|uniref:bifunctional 3,4-dihydroxy-2-butanone-4-phosphate synthase/GTP cyclohydrolase II n=1 Tax=Corynebacterium renale TaxID=1724 RepID=UPI000DA2F046|nr:bifunctional 3,4-dihydroxy-2-butanone-4-phosphate synthase/GTP cyclohydrolase II [Corynebacterium renale]SQG64746.1 bifunctional 3,4-dihydroxy-2-butanone 4-phosphate synthase/GTP cyclohydrolase II protein [Corynebacterium renale]STC96130.1 bifunctional 3,4-dihydroxy-2-butanone 4-phosphate synthase/GTP cyclohydrolase II protein [Corynebacterium renale]
MPVGLRAKVVDVTENKSGSEYTESAVRLDSVDEAIAEIAAGRAVVVVDNEDRENEGDLIFAAEKATPELMAFMVRYSSGYICAPVTNAIADRLGLPPMVAANEDARGTAYTVTVDANTGTTGISATSRAETVRRLANPDSVPSDFTRPGHVVPLRAREGGVLVRDGHTEASIDLARAAGLYPAGVLCEIVSEDDPTDMARAPELRRFADEHGLKMISIAQLIDWRRHHETYIHEVVTTKLPTQHGTFTMHGFTNTVTGQEHVALSMGLDTDTGHDESIMVRMHSECLTGDVFGSHRCDCGQQLDRALEMIAKQGVGVVVYLRGHEGRGIGLIEKLRAYKLQDEGMDTVDANLKLEQPVDAREFDSGAQILKLLGVSRINLLTNNPDKANVLRSHGLDVAERTSIPVDVYAENERYLRTKRDRMGHDVPALAEWDQAHSQS